MILELDSEFLEPQSKNMKIYFQNHSQSTSLESLQILLQWARALSPTAGA